MATYADILQSVNAYPIPHRTLEGICISRGIKSDDIATTDGVQGEAYRLAHADLLMWLADAPNVSQGGQSYSFSEDQRSRFRMEAMKVFDELENKTKKTIFGYKGSKL